MNLTRWTTLALLCCGQLTLAQDQTKPAPPSASVPQPKQDLPGPPEASETQKKLRDAREEIQKAQERMRQAQLEINNARREYETAARSIMPLELRERNQRRYMVVSQDAHNRFPQSFVKTYGLDFVELDPALRSQLTLPVDEGLVIVAVTAGGLADQAGIKINDVITKLDLQPVVKVEQARQAIANSSKKSVYFDLIREGKPVHLSMNKPAADPATAQVTYWIGIPVAPIDPTLRSHLPNLPADAGLIVTDVVADSPAAKSDVHKYDILMRANGQSLPSNDTLIKLIQQSEGKEMKLELMRAGKVLTVMVTPEKQIISSFKIYGDSAPFTASGNAYFRSPPAPRRQPMPENGPKATDQLLVNPQNFDGAMIRVVPGSVEGVPLYHLRNTPGQEYLRFDTSANPAGLRGRLETEMKELADKLERLRKTLGELEKAPEPGQQDRPKP